MTLEVIEQKLKQRTTITPQEASEWKFILSGEYYFVLGQLEDILLRKPSAWNAKRPEFKSDTACERWWQATEDGLNETALKLREKKLTKMISAMSTLIQVKEREANSQY